MKAWQLLFIKQNNFMWLFIHLIELLLWHPTIDILYTQLLTKNLTFPQENQ